MVVNYGGMIDCARDGVCTGLLWRTYTGVNTLEVETASNPGVISSSGFLLVMFVIK